jgi:hypothetical protein
LATIPVSTTSTANETEDKTITAIVQSFIALRSKNRKPNTMVQRTAATTKKINFKSRAGTIATMAGVGSYLPVVRPTYTNQALDRFEDAFRSDKLIQNGIVKRAELVVGKHGTIVMDTTQEFDDPKDRATELAKVQNNTKYQEARKKIQKLHAKPDINFHSNLKSAIIQKSVYGRSAIELAGSDPDTGLPEALYVLNSKRLAQPEIEPNTWKFLGVHYLDLQKGPSGLEDVLPAENLIYFTNKDFHVSPGSLYYGLSELEGIVDGSDSKRIAKQQDIKEIMKSNWAPFLIMKFLNPNISVAQMQQIVDGIQPGVPFAHKQDVEATKIDLQSNLSEITNAVDFLNKESLREMGVPSFIGGYEAASRYSNAQQILLAYREIELEADRTYIKDTIQTQWLNKLFYQLLDINPDTDEPDVKLSYEFDDISFETTLDKTNAALLLFDRGLIGGEEVLKIAGHENSIEEYKLMQLQKDQQRQQALQRFQQNPNQNNSNDPNNPNNQDQQQQGNGKVNQPDGSIPAADQKSTTVKKRSGSYNNYSDDSSDFIYRKFAETLDSIVQQNE